MGESEYPEAELKDWFYKEKNASRICAIFLSLNSYCYDKL
jgi:hypothetical protein